jgi:hypothetical protein
MPDETPKIVQIGFSRCGTHSLHELFARSGLPAVHYDRGRLGARMLHNQLHGRPLLAGYERTVAFTDMQAQVNRSFLYQGFKQFRQLDRQNPGAYFILNTRNEDAWIASMLRNENGRHLPWLMRVLGFACIAELERYWRTDWRRHHADVVEHFAGSARFLVFDIERDDPATLARFLDAFSIDPSHYGHRYQSDSLFAAPAS